MIKKLEKVRELLHEGDAESIVSEEGIVAYKVLDKNEALMAVKKGCQGIYADRITASACRILEENLIIYEYLEKVEEVDSSH